MLHRSDKTTARYVASEIPGEMWAALALFDADVVDAGGGEDAEAGRGMAAKWLSGLQLRP
jgi:hypothetical protein